MVLTLDYTWSLYIGPALWPTKYCNLYYFIHSFIQSFLACTTGIAPNVDIILQSGWFWANPRQTDTELVLTASEVDAMIIHQETACLQHKPHTGCHKTVRKLLNKHLLMLFFWEQRKLFDLIQNFKEWPIFDFIMKKKHYLHSAIGLSQRSCSTPDPVNIIWYNINNI